MCSNNQDMNHCVFCSRTHSTYTFYRKSIFLFHILDLLGCQVLISKCDIRAPLSKHTQSHISVTLDFPIILYIHASISALFHQKIVIQENRLHLFKIEFVSELLFYLCRRLQDIVLWKPTYTWRCHVQFNTHVLSTYNSHGNESPTQQSEHNSVQNVSPQEGYKCLSSSHRF